MISLKPIIEKLFPENYKGGECGVFAHKLVQFPIIGDTLASKTAAVRNLGVPAELLGKAFRGGDVVITNESQQNGHVAVINNIDYIAQCFQVTESNFHLDGRVHHTRIISFDSPHIVGVIRGPALFPLPTTTYPIEIQVRILMNNQPLWNSLLRRMAELQEWYDVNSGGKIQLTIDYKDVSLSGWPTGMTGSGIGAALTEVIDENWYRKNVLTLVPDADIVAFVMKKSDFAGAVDKPNTFEIGYSYEPHFPIKTFMAMDENDNYFPNWYPGLQGLSTILAHEISHGLYGLCVSSKYPSGTDLTHTHFGITGLPPQPEKIFEDFDYDVLFRTINKN